MLTELTVARSESELLRRVLGWFAIGHPRFGKRLPRAMLDLPAAFREAGLPTPQLRSTTELGVGGGVPPDPAGRDPVQSAASL
jgi:hypothetical protein